MPSQKTSDPQDKNLRDPRYINNDLEPENVCDPVSFARDDNDRTAQTEPTPEDTDDPKNR